MALTFRYSLLFWPFMYLLCTKVIGLWACNCCIIVYFDIRGVVCALILMTSYDWNEIEFEVDVAVQSGCGE